MKKVLSASLACAALVLIGAGCSPKSGNNPAPAAQPPSANAPALPETGSPAELPETSEPSSSAPIPAIVPPSANPVPAKPNANPPAQANPVTAAPSAPSDSPYAKFCQPGVVSVSVCGGYGLLNTSAPTGSLIFKSVKDGSVVACPESSAQQDANCRQIKTSCGESVKCK